MMYVSRRRMMRRGNPCLSGAIILFQFVVWIITINSPASTKHSLPIGCAKQNQKNKTNNKKEAETKKQKKRGEEFAENKKKICVGLGEEKKNQLRKYLDFELNDRA